MDTEKTEKGLSRRGFMKGAAAAAVITGMAGREALAAEKPAAAKSAPSAKYDVVVVGSGIAGLSAAIKAAQAGAKVAVLEKAESMEALLIPPEEASGRGPSTWARARQVAWNPKAGNNTERSGRSISALEIQGGKVNPRITVEEVVRRTVESGHGAVNPEVIRAWAERLNKDIDWLIKEIGLRPRLRRSGVPDYSFGPIVAPMTAHLKKAGGQVFYDHAAVKLLTDEMRRVIGVRALTTKGPRDFRAKATVLAPGGFEGNAELCAIYISPFIGYEGLLTGTPFNTGEWVKMAEEVGARLINMNQFHVRTPDRKGGTGLKLLDELSKYGIVVDIRGHRMYDEARLPQQTDQLAHEMIQRGSNGFLIFDEALKAKHLKEYEGYSKSPQEYFITAPTLEKLAELEGISPAGLVNTVKAFNAAVSSEGTALSADPPKGALADFPKTAVKIETPPFTSFKVLVGLNQTVGGFKVNAKMQVLDLKERPIPGLYVAGEPIMGNIIYENYKVASDGATGLEIALTTGCIAGEAAAATVKKGLA